MSYFKIILMHSSKPLTIIKVMRTICKMQRSGLILKNDEKIMDGLKVYLERR